MRVGGVPWAGESSRGCPPPSFVHIILSHQKQPGVEGSCLQVQSELTASQKPSRENTQLQDAGGGENKPWCHLQALGGGSLSAKRLLLGVSVLGQEDCSAGKVLGGRAQGPDSVPPDPK